MEREFASVRVAARREKRQLWLIVSVFDGRRRKDEDFGRCLVPDRVSPPNRDFDKELLQAWSELIPWHGGLLSRFRAE